MKTKQRNIGQTEADHWLKAQKYAVQCRFASGWDYIGSNDFGDRDLYDTFHEANEELTSEMPHLVGLGYSSDDWRVVEYVPNDDNKGDL